MTTGDDLDLFERDQVPPEDIPWTLDRAVATFLNRWLPSVLQAEHRPVMDAELRALIADAKSLEK